MDDERTQPAPTPAYPTAPQATAPPAPDAAAHGTQTQTTDERPLAAVAYILTWLTGLIIFLVAKKEQRYARWHAVQAIGLGIAAFVIVMVLNVINMALALGGGGFMMASVVGLLMFAFWIGLIIVIIMAAVKAYKGESLRLPVIADFADKYA